MAQLSAGEKLCLREYDHSSRMYLAVLVPDDVFTATVLNNEDRGAITIEYENVVGTDANAEVEQIVYFGTAAGLRDIGTARLKTITAGSDVMTIEENDLDLAVGHHISCKKLWLPRGKLPTIDVSGADVVFTKDGDLYDDDQNLYIPPVVVMGPPAAALIDSGTGKATVKFVDEYSWYPSGASRDTATWDYDGGVWQSGTGTALDPHIVEYDTAGWYWVSLTVTDDATVPKTKVGWRPVYIYDADNLPYVDFAASARENSLQGTRQSFTVFGDAAQAEFPDGTWVMRFNRDWYGGAEQVLETRYPWRGNVKYVGFLKAGSVQVADDMSAVSFETEDITYVLDTLPGFGDVLVYDATPSKWTEMVSLDLVKAVYHVLERHTTALTICDFRYSLALGAAEIKIREQRWGKDSILRQCQEVLSERGIFANLCATVQGCLEIRQDPCLMKTADRAGNVTKVADLTQDDFYDIDVDREPYRKVHLLRVGGFTYDGATATPLLAKSPGVPEVTAVTETQHDGLILSPTDGQDGLNRIAGDLAAKMDNPLARTTVGLVGNYDVLDAALQERITFPLAAADNVRGLAFTDSDNWVVREVAIDEDIAGGFVRGVVATLEAESDGVDGLEIPVPEPGDDDWPDPPDPDPPDDPPPPGGGGFVDTGRRMFSCNEGVVCTDDWTAVSPTWYKVNTGLPVLPEHLWVWKILRDPWHWWTTAGREKTLWAIVGAEVRGAWLYKMEDFPDGTWTLSYDVDTLPGPSWAKFINDFAGSIEADGLWYALVSEKLWGLDACALYCLRSTTGGAPWTVVGTILPADNYPAMGYAIWPHYKQAVIGLAHHSAGAELFVLHQTSEATDPRVRRCINNGVDWALTGLPSDLVNAKPMRIIVPYNAVDWGDTDVVIGSHKDTASSEREVQRSTTSGGAWADIAGVGGLGKVQYLEMAPSGRDDILVIGGDVWPVAWFSDNAGVDWVQWNIGGSMAYPISKTALVNWNEDGTISDILVHDLFSNRIVSIDDAGVETDKTGNLGAIVTLADLEITKFERDTLGTA